MPKKHLIIFVILYLSISHIILPVINKGQDFLFFSTWDMYSHRPSSSVVDLTWDEGATYLIRDFRNEASKSGVNIHAIFFLLNAGKFEKLREIHKQSILDFCKCEKVFIFHKDIGLYDHLIQKQSGSITDMEAL
jgi:hypothetical protein